MSCEKIKTRKAIHSLLFLTVLSSFFLFNVNTVHAGLFDWIGDTAGDAFFYVINIILYAVFTLVSYPVTWSSMLFKLTVDPVAVNTLFAMPAIYLLWQMVRDFFNLFFILTLLFIAFATIFQIDSFNYKRSLGKLLLMALLVNFSFPIARFVIDIANVPMYFFMESIFSDPSQAKAENVTNRFLGTSSLEELILGKQGFGVADIKGDSDITTKLLVGIVFMFLFGISLLVLAILFLIRSLMLVVLIIFSSVGFAGMVIPGFRSYASTWWDNLLKYAFFGPAAMLMILVSLKFLEGFTGPGGIGNTTTIANNSSATGGGTYLASMVAVMAPIVFIWIAISVGQQMGIRGAGAVTGNAQKFSKWAGRKGARGLGYTGAFVGTAGVATPGRLQAAKYGAQEGMKNFKKTGKIAGVAVPGAQRFTTTAQEERNAKSAGFFTGGRKGYADAQKELARKRTYEKADELKKGNVSNSELLSQIGAENRKADGSFKDPIAAGGAAMVLADRKALTGAKDFVNALQALGDNTKEISTLIEKAGGDALKLDAKQYETAMSSFDTGAFKATGEDVVLKKSLEGKLRKEGKAKVIVDYQVSKRAPETSEADAYQSAYAGALDKMGASDIVKQGDIFDDKHFMTYAQNRAAVNPRWAQAVMDEIVKSPSNAQHEGKWAGVLVQSKPATQRAKEIMMDTNIAAARQERDAGKENSTT